MTVRPSRYSPSGDPYDAVRDEVHEFEVDGMRVAFRRMPIHRDPLDGILEGRRYGKDQVLLGHPGEQRRYAVEIDGAQVGWALRHHGGGHRPYVAMAMFSGYQSGIGRHGYPELDGQRPSTENRSYELSELAPRFVRWHRLGIAMTWDDIVDAVRKRDEQEARDKRRMREQARADDVRRERQIRDREQGRLDSLGGLEEIARDFDGRLTNYQAEALQKAIEHFRSVGIQWHEREFLDRMEGKPPRDH